MRKNNVVKVLINIPNPYKDNGGVSNHFLGLSHYFPKDQVSFCYTGGLKKYNKILATPVYIYQYLRFIFKIITFKPDVVNLNPSLKRDAVIRDGIFLLIAKSFNKKIIVFWHGWKENFGEEIEAKHFKLFKSVYNKADIFVVLSSAVKKKLEQWQFCQPIFSTTTKVDDYLIKEFDISAKKETKNILFLGRLEKEKGIFETLGAFQLSQKRYPDITLTYAGNGPDEKKLKKIIEKEKIKNVFFLGFIRNNEKIRAFLSADIFILPSYTEGIPTSVLEAMAFGIPIITTPVGGIPDFFIDTKMGYLVNSKNPADFSEKINFLYSNRTKWSEISKFNHNYAVENFMASAIAAKMMKLYKNVLA